MLFFIYGGTKMNDRIKEIRKSLGLTLEKFGERLGVTKTTISRIENGINNVTEQMKKSICREFNINEDWLQTGEGEMYRKSNDDISEIIDEIMKGENEFYIKIFKTFARLDKSELLALEKILDKYVEISTSTNQKKMVFEENYLDNNNIKESKQEYNKIVFDSTSNKDSKEQTTINDDLEELSTTTEEAEAAYIKSRSNHVQKMEQSALNTFADTIKNAKNINAKVSNQ